jgi:hypothetical protein
MSMKIPRAKVVMPLLMFLSSINPINAQEITDLQFDCDKGDAESCLELGFTYRYRTDEPSDYEKALEPLLRACELGSGEGCVSAASQLTPTLETYKPVARSITLYERGCELGTATGCLNAGIIHERGSRTPANKALALELYQQGCKINDRYSCRSAGRLKEVLLGRPTTRGAEPVPMSLLGTTIGETTIDQLQAMHPVNFQTNPGCAGGATYSILGERLDASLSGSVNFFFNDKSVLAGLTASTDKKYIDRIHGFNDERYTRVPKDKAVSLAADPLWLYGDTEVMTWAPGYANEVVMGFYDWGYRGSCTFGWLIQ